MTRDVALVIFLAERNELQSGRCPVGVGDDGVFMTTPSETALRVSTGGHGTGQGHVVLLQVRAYLPVCSCDFGVGRWSCNIAYQTVMQRITLPLSV